MAQSHRRFGVTAIALDPRDAGYRSRPSHAVQLAGELPGRTHLYRTHLGRTHLGRTLAA